MSEDTTPIDTKALSAKKRTLSEHTRVMLPAGVVIGVCAWVVGYWINSYDARIAHNAAALEVERAQGITRDSRIQALEINASHTQQSLQTIQKTTESINDKVERLIDEVRKRP